MAEDIAESRHHAATPAKPQCHFRNLPLIGAPAGGRPPDQAPVAPVAGGIGARRPTSLPPPCERPTEPVADGIDVTRANSRIRGDP